MDEEYGGWVDQVVRLRKFQSEHPEWNIHHVRSAGYWEATRQDRSGGIVVLVNYQLQDVLNKVERFLASEDEDQA